MDFSEDPGAPEGFDSVICSVFMLWSMMDLHFSISPLVFGSALTWLVVVTRGANRKKKEKKRIYQIRDQKSLTPHFLSPQVKQGLFSVFCIYLEVEEEGRVAGGLKLQRGNEGQR